MFAGGLIRWAVEVTTRKKMKATRAPGALFSSGLIAAGACLMLAIVLRVVADAAKPETFWPGCRIGGLWAKHWLCCAFNENWPCRRSAIAVGVFMFGLLGRRCFISRGRSWTEGNWQR